MRLVRIGKTTPGRRYRVYLHNCEFFGIVPMQINEWRAYVQKNMG